MGQCGWYRASLQCFDYSAEGKMNVLLLGSTGMAGSQIYESLLLDGLGVIGVARKNADVDADISDDSTLIDVLSSQKFDAIINAAAIVNIDYCEKYPLESWAVNARPLATLSNWSQEFDIPLLHISTDHFFPYGENKAHSEGDPVFFLNEYAKQKYAAEAYALASRHALVIRTSFLGKSKTEEKSLLDWAIESITSGKEINLFRDAWTSSIDVKSFAGLACKLFFEKKHRGLINLAAKEVYSKEVLIRYLAAALGLDHSNCLSSSVNATIPMRANCLGLDVSYAEQVLGLPLPTMKDVCEALREEYQGP